MVLILILWLWLNPISSIERSAWAGVALPEITNMNLCKDHPDDYLAFLPQNWSAFSPGHRTVVSSWHDATICRDLLKPTNSTYNKTVKQWASLFQGMTFGDLIPNLKVTYRAAMQYGFTTAGPPLPCIFKSLIY